MKKIGLLTTVLALFLLSLGVSHARLHIGVISALKNQIERILAEGTATPTWLVNTATPTATPTFIYSPTPTSSATVTPTFFVTPSPTQTPVFSYTPTGTPTSTSTASSTPTSTSTATPTPTVGLVVSFNGLPVSQTYTFGQTNVASVQIILTRDALENVIVRELEFTAGGDIDWTADVKAGSVELYRDNSTDGLYNPGTATLVMGAHTFSADGSVVFTSLAGLVTVGSAPVTLLLVFDLNMAGVTDKTFNHAIDSTSVVAAGATSGRDATVSGSVTGETHLVAASTPTPSHTDTYTLTHTPTHTSTNTPTHTSTETSTYTPTDTPTYTSTETPTYTSTETPTKTPTATDTPTETSTYTPTETPTETSTETPSHTTTYTPTVTPTYTRGHSTPTAIPPGEWIRHHTYPPNAGHCSSSVAVGAGYMAVGDWDSGWVDVYTEVGVYLYSIPANMPFGMTIDSNSELYVADPDNGEVRGYYLGPSTYTYDYSWSANGNMDAPLGVKIDANGNLVVADWGFDYGYGMVWNLSWDDDSVLHQTTSGPEMNPYDVAFDSNGNIYATDYDYNGQVVVFNRNYQYLNSFSGSDWPNSLYGPFGIGVDSSGNLYISDPDNARVVYATAQGAYLGEIPISSPSYLVLDSADRLFVANPDTCQVEQYARNPLASTPTVTLTPTDTPTPLSPSDWMPIAMLTPDTISGLGSCPPIGVAVGAGYIAVSEPNSNVVQVFDSTGTFLYDVPAIQPYGIAIDSEGELYIAEYGNWRVTGYYLTPSGPPVYDYYWTGQGSLSQYPYSVEIDANGDLTVVDSNGSVWNLSWKDDTVLHQTTGGPSMTPVDVAFDGSGNVYVADYYNSQIVVFNSNYQFIRLINGSSWPTVPMNYVWGVALDSSGKLYISDQNNGRVVYATAQGDYLGQINVPGGYPYDLALDSMGDLFVAEYYSCAVWEFARYFAETDTPTATDTPTGTLTETAVPTDTPLPTDTPSVTNTPTETVTPTGTLTETITPTDTPTDTPTRDHATPTPVWAPYGYIPTNCSPRGIAVGAGYIAVSYPNDYYVRIFDSNGGYLYDIYSYAPYGLAIDSYGELYIAEPYNNRVIGYYLGPTYGDIVYDYEWYGQGNLDGPYGVELDADGNLVVADIWEGTVWNLSWNDDTVLRQTQGVRSMAPLDVALDAGGNVYVTSSNEYNVYVFDSDYRFKSSFNGSSWTTALSYPPGIEADSLGNLFISDPNNYRVVYASPQGGYLSEINALSLGVTITPYGLALDSADDLFIADQNYCAVWETAPNFGPTPTHTMTLSETDTPSFTNTPSETFTPTGTLTEVDTPTFTITPTFTPSPTPTRAHITPTPTPSGAWSLKSSFTLPDTGGEDSDCPSHMAVGAGFLAVSDRNNERVLVYDSNANYLYAIELDYDPYGLAIDSHGELYICDPYYYSSVHGYYLGQNEATYDYTWNAQGSFYEPMAVKIDSNGNLVVADYNGSIWNLSWDDDDVLNQNSYYGGSSDFFDLGLDSSGNIYVLGQQYDFGYGDYLPYIFEFNKNFSDENSFPLDYMNVYYSRSIGVDSSGNLYVADSTNYQRIVYLSPQGSYLGEFYTSNYPDYLALDGENRMFVSNDDSCRVEEYVRTLPTTSVWPVYDENCNNLCPGGVAVGAGYMAICDVYQNCVQIFDGNGRYLYSITGMSLPVGMAIDSYGELYIANYGYGQVDGYLLGPSSATYDYTWTGQGILSGPSGIKIDANGNLVVADFDWGSGNGTVYNLSWNDDMVLRQAQGFHSLYPADVALDAGGNLFITDYYNSRVVVCDNNWNFTSMFSGSSWGIPLSNPQGIQADPAGNLYISDADNSRVVYASPQGNYLGGFGIAGTPRYLALSPSNMLYVADGDSCVVRGYQR